METGHGLRVGYVPEHFSTPLHFAQTYHELNAILFPFPSGTGHMITALQNNEIDVGIGLTEAWISGLGNAHTESRDAGYKLLGQYTESPLCWAISTGSQRNEITSVDGLNGRKIGVSRIGSGSYVMGFVLADQHGWFNLPSEAPFSVIPLQTFDKLRAAANDGTADFFMWEHFTSKRYYDNGEIKKIGEIYTPWPAWEIVGRPDLVGGSRLEDFFMKLELGIAYFHVHQDEAVKYISTELDYSEADARQWLETVRFSTNVHGVRKGTVENVVAALQKAGVLNIALTDAILDGMIAIPRID